MDDEFNDEGPFDGEEDQFGLFSRGELKEQSARLNKIGKSAFKEEIEGKMKEQEANEPTCKEVEDKANQEHQKYLKENKLKIEQMYERLRKAELKSNQDVFDKYVTGNYRVTVKQIIKICKLKTLKKFMEEMQRQDTCLKNLEVCIDVLF